MRVYLDTNIIAFMLFDKSQICSDVQAIIDDYDNVLATSVICVDELIHLCQIGKIAISKNSPIKSAVDITDWLESIGIKISEIKKKHLEEVAGLYLYEDHRDPNDRLVIAQAISDQMTLVSSDRKFSRYTKFGLDFVFNAR